MPKVHVEDFYDDDENDGLSGRIRTYKHKNPFKDDDVIYEKNKNKRKTCKMKKSRMQKENY